MVHTDCTYISSMCIPSLCEFGFWNVQFTINKIYWVLRIFNFLKIN